MEEAYNSLKSKGASFVMPPTARQGEGIKLAVLLDPDGLQISLSEAVRKERPLPA